MDTEMNDSATAKESETSISKKPKFQKDYLAESEAVAISAAELVLTSDISKSSNSDLSDHDGNDNDGVDDDDQDQLSDFDSDDYMFSNVDEDDDEDDSEYLRMQAQFDNVDLPPGVEASVSWLKDPASSANIPTESNAVSFSAGAGLSATLCLDKVATSSSSTALAELSSDAKEREKESSEDEVLRKFKDFKRFDIVDDFSDHHFSGMGFSEQQPHKSWGKKIQDEWRILEKDLPETIYVRVYESRIDLLRAVIVGPAGTPYHDGLFVFDVYFPPTYPDVPPMVYYYSGGLRLNPNLYDCGKVCLSLLNTWSGKKSEMWIPESSTMLQVLVSIQALILNAKPFFNEPGYEKSYTGADGAKRANAYNEDVFILSLKTMIYTIRRPPKYFEDFVKGHFRERAHDILSACKAYTEGAVVGSVKGGGGQDTTSTSTGTSEEEAVTTDDGGSKAFKKAVRNIMKGVITNFIIIGAEECDKFRSS